MTWETAIALTVFVLWTMSRLDRLERVTTLTPGRITR